MITRVIFLLFSIFQFGTAYCLETLQHDDAGANKLTWKEMLSTVAVKSNLLYDLTTTFNVGVEFCLNDCLSLDILGNYNPWTFSNNKKFKHVLVQPELRYWIREPYKGHFAGAHLMYSSFNAGNINLPFNILSGLENYRYRGNGYGLGLFYGYQWALAPHWSIEGAIGLGHMYMDYTKYECDPCGMDIGKGHKHYFGATKAAVSLIYTMN